MINKNLDHAIFLEHATDLVPGILKQLTGFNKQKSLFFCSMRQKDPLPLLITYNILDRQEL